MEDYQSILAARQNHATRLDTEIENRYGIRAQDCQTWSTLYLDELTNSGINHLAPIPQEIDITGEFYPEPLPYSPKFIYRFARLIQGPADEIAPELEWLFDDFDSVEYDYLRGLTERLKSLSVDKPNTLTVVRGNGHVSTLEFKMTDAALVRQMRETSVWLLDDATCRAGFSAIKYWLKRRAKEIRKLSLRSTKDRSVMPSTRTRKAKTWGDFLINGFNEDCLKKLANKLNLIDDDGRPTDEAKQAAWVAILEALHLTGYLVKMEFKPLHKLLASTFPGARTPTANTISNGVNLGNERVKRIFQMAKAAAVSITKGPVL